MRVIQSEKRGAGVKTIMRVGKITGSSDQLDDHQRRSTSLMMTVTHYKKNKKSKAHSNKVISSAAF